MKVIELLTKIANGEEAPERIMYKGIEWAYNNKQYYRVDEVHTRNIWSGYNFNILDDEVEIIEEDKKIEKIDLSEWAEITYQEDWEMLTKDFNRNCNLFVNKINEIIDYLEEKEQ